MTIINNSPVFITRSPEDNNEGCSSQWDVEVLDKEKKKARGFLKSRLLSIGEDACKKASGDIYDRLTSLPELDQAQTVFCYISIPHEVETLSIIEYLLGRGKRVCVPRCMKNGIMDARLLTGLAELTPKPPFDIPEPAESAVLVKPEDIDFAIVPGLAFDRQGGRIGKGAGYYDRYLRKCRAVKCGVCFDDMLIDRLPMGENDVPMDIVLTDKVLIRFTKMEETHA